MIPKFEQIMTHKQKNIEGLPTNWIEEPNQIVPNIHFVAFVPGCENIKISSERISRALAAENSRGGRGMLKSVRSPRCRAIDGEFEEIQCDNEIVSSCWCVDAAGFEASIYSDFYIFFRTKERTNERNEEHRTSQLSMALYILTVYLSRMPIKSIFTYFRCYDVFLVLTFTLTILLIIKIFS
jgi:hypothetical protein